MSPADSLVVTEPNEQLLTVTGRWWTRRYSLTMLRRNLQATPTVTVKVDDYLDQPCFAPTVRLPTIMFEQLLTARTILASPDTFPYHYERVQACSSSLDDILLLNDSTASVSGTGIGVPRAPSLRIIHGHYQMAKAKMQGHTHVSVRVVTDRDLHQVLVSDTLRPGALMLVATLSGMISGYLGYVIAGHWFD